MREISLIFLGSGIGGVVRFILGSIIYSYTGRNFPYATLMVNLSGAFGSGFFFVLITERFTNLAPYLISFLLVGLFGGYTTFSAFSIETLRLLQTGRIIYAMVNILGHMGLSILLVWLGYTSGQKFLGLS